MGSGASKNKPKNGLKNKVRAVGIMGAAEKEASETPSRTVVITDTSAAWEMLRSGAETVNTDNLSKERLTFKTVNTGNSLGRRADDCVEESTGVVYDTVDNVEQDNVCDICKKDSGFRQYPCRICTRVFHEDCLKRAGQCQDERSVNQLHGAMTTMGWSCYHCENINTLLTEEEMDKLVEDFDEQDVNHDSEINRNEFLAYKQESFKKRYGTNMSDGEKQLESKRFDCMDVDSTGSIDWWEFLNYESVACLQKRPRKNSIVAELTRKEIQRARECFHVFDEDRNGSVSEREAREAYENWYRRFMATDQGNSSGGNDIDSHVDSSVKVLMTADNDDTGMVSWDEYLRDQAVIYISARPNTSKIFNASRLGQGLMKTSLVNVRQAEH